MALKLFKPYVSEDAKRMCLDVLNSDNLAEGLVVKQFENDFSSFCSIDNVVALNSGTSALHLGYQLAGIKQGDEVIVPVLTCTATNIPLLHLGAKIVFADIDEDLNINIQDVKNKITDRTKAIVFVHFGGNNRGLSEILDIAGERGIKVIEDAAQAVGSGYWGKGDFACVSLQAIKTLTSGDGGFLICKDKTDHNKAKRLRWFGYDRDMKQKFGDCDLTEVGYKYHMNNIMAAIGLGNLMNLPKVLAHRASLSFVYKKYGLFANVWLAGGFTDDYKKMKKIMLDAGYEIGQHHYRNDKYTVFNKFKSPCLNMDILENKYFFVPYHMGVTLEQAHEIGGIYKRNK